MAFKSLFLILASKLTSTMGSVLEAPVTLEEPIDGWDTWNFLEDCYGMGWSCRYRGSENP